MTLPVWPDLTRVTWPYLYDLTLPVWPDLICMTWPYLCDLTLPVGVKVHVVLPVDDGVGGGAPEVAVAGLDEVDLLLGVNHVTLELTSEDRPVDVTPRHACSRDMKK